MIGPARPKRPSHGKEVRNEAVGRPNQRSTACRNPRSQPGACGRKEYGRPSRSGLFFSSGQTYLPSGHGGMRVQPAGVYIESIPQSHK